MDDARKGQIAVALVKQRIAKAGFNFDPDQLKRELGNVGKELDIPDLTVDELMEFIDFIVGELYEGYRKARGEKDPRTDGDLPNF